jgi:hypothetical protein
MISDGAIEAGDALNGTGGAMGQMPLLGLDEELEAVGVLPPPSFGGNEVFHKEQVAEAALEWFRANGFPYRKLARHVCMQEINRLAMTDAKSLVHTITAYHVADTYHPHRFHASAEGMKSPFQSYSDDKALLRAINLEIEKGGSLGSTMFSMLLLVLGTQACANFRPGFACYLYRKYLADFLKGEPRACRVLDTSTGYGGRLTGFLASGLAGRGGQYIGIDPNTRTYIGNQRLAFDLAPPGSVDLICQPAEDVPVERIGERSCDFAFTSPPYFTKEHYAEESTQSWKRYGEDKSGESWKRGFLAPTMRLQYACLKHGAYSIVNVADVKLSSRVYPIKQWTIECGKEVGFDFLSVEAFPMSQRVGANQAEGVAEEPVLIFRKS